MIIVQDLMSRQGLPCIYNCSDPSTPSLEFAQTSCRDNWISGGSQFWSPATGNTFTIGSYVRRPYTPNPNNLPAPYYVAISNTGLDIDPFANDPASGWKKCVTYQILDETEDYLRFSVNEIDAMLANSQLDMLLTHEDGRKIYVKYHFTLKQTTKQIKIKIPPPATMAQR